MHLCGTARVYVAPYSRLKLELLLRTFIYDCILNQHIIAIHSTKLPHSYSRFSTSLIDKRHYIILRSVMPTQPVDSQPQFWPRSSKFHTTLRQSDPGRFETASALLDRGADINGLNEVSSRRGPVGAMVSREQVTALYDAADRADYDAVQFLLDKGADVRARNRTGMSIAIGPFPFHNAIDTLCGLDAMRTSKDQKIVLLAEERFGPETDEDFIKRRDAFDTLVGYYPYNSTTLFKPKIEKVISGEQKINAATKQCRRVEKHAGASPRKQERYKLRKRDPNVSYV